MPNPLSRREVLRFGAFTTVGGVLTPGIALAQAITTDATGVVARDVQLSVGGTTIPAYDARPEAAGRYPIVVAISGFTGNSEQHKDVVRRFAHAGYYAITPELYSREGGMQGKNFPSGPFRTRRAWTPSAWPTGSRCRSSVSTARRTPGSPPTT